MFPGRFIDRIENNGQTVQNNWKNIKRIRKIWQKK